MKKNLLLLLALILFCSVKLSAQVNGPVVFCSNATENFQTALSGGYAWSISPSSGTNISTPSAQTTNITFGTAVQYTITVVTSAPTNTFVLTVDNNTPADPTVSPQTICEGSNAILSATGTGTMAWYNVASGGTTLGTGTTYSTPALFVTTTFYVESSNAGCISNRVPVTVSVNPAPNISINGLSTICSGNGVSLTTTINSGGPISAYLWQPGSLTTSNITPTPAVSTTYTLTATNSMGCQAVFTQPVTVNSTPTVTVNSSSICNGSSASLNASGATTYSWAPATGLSSTTGTSVTANPAFTTTYTITGTSSGCSSTETSTVTVYALPTITANSQTVCQGQNATLTAAGGLSYTWTPGGMTSSSVNVSPATTTIYTVTGISAQGCVNSGTGMVTVNALPTITANNSTICAGSAATLTAAGGMTYVWNTGATTSSIMVYPPFTSSYTVTGADVNGCSNSAIGIVTVNALPSVDAGLDQSICEYSDVTLSGSGGGVIAATWAPSGGATEATTFNYTATPLATTAYVFTGVDANGCSNTDTVVITLIPAKNITGTITSTVGTVTGDAYLLKYNSVQLAFDTFEVQPLITNQYLFSSIPAEDFLVKIVPDTAIHTTLVPTYYGDVYQWDSAVIVSHSCASDFQADITIIELPVNTGTGFISGHIIEDAGFGQRLGGGHNHIMAPGGPLKGIDIKLGKNPGGGIQARTMSDSLGYYEFNNLPDDTFKIYVDIPGLPMDSSYIFTISAGNDSHTGLDFFADSNSVFPIENAVGLANLNPAKETAVSVFPNPAKQNVKIQFVTQDGNAGIELINAQGSSVFSKELKALAKGKHELQVDLDQLNLVAGVYLVRIITEHSSEIKKLIVTD
ncbi:MAG TPA: T9SS type A sorting domain-containing protein [Bacteroidia bacterium]